MTSVLRSSLLNLAATVVSLVAGFLVSVIVARLLGPAGSGTVAFMMWLVVSASAVADRGLPQTVLRNVAAGGDGDWKPLVRAAFSLFLASTGLVFGLALAYGLYRHAVGESAEGWLWSVTALLFAFYALSAFSTAAARGRDRFRETAASTVCGGIAQVPLVFAGAWLFGPAGALCGMIARYLPQALHLPRYVDFRLPARSRALTPEMRGYGRSMWVSDMIDIVVLSRIEFLVIGFFLSNADVGYFAVAVVFAGLVGQLAMQLSPALIVGFSGEDGDPSPLYESSLRLTALFMLPVGLGGAAIVPELLPLVFGEAFRPAASAAALLLAVSAFSGLAVVPWAWLAAGGHGGSLMRITLTSAAAIVTLLVLAVPQAGIVGAAVVRAVVEAMTLGLLLWAVRAKGGPGLPFGALAKAVLAAALCAAAAHAVTQMVTGFAGIALALAAGAAVYALGVRLTRLVTPQEADGLMEIVGPRLSPSARRSLRKATGLFVGPARRISP